MRISPLSWSRQAPHDWVKATDRVVASAKAQDRDVVLVTRSLGCWAAAGWRAESAGGPLVRVFLVAPPDPSGDAFPAETAPAFLDVTPRTLHSSSLVLAGTNDPYGRLETAPYNATDWGWDLEIVGALGHINTASRLGNWSQGHRLLDSLVREGDSC